MAVADTNRVKADDAQYVLHSWSVRSAIDPIPIAGAEGRYFWDYDGKRYLDFASQLVNVSLGHQHPKVIAAIKEQADRLCTIGPMMANEKRSELARLLAEVTPGDLTMSFFTNGGAEANENAIKLARWFTGRDKIVARYRSYHGATAGAISATGDPRRWPAEPGVPGIVRMLDPYTYRCPAGHPDPCPVCTGAPHLEEILQYEGAAERRRRDPRDRDRDERRHPAAARLPPVGARGLRPPRDPAHPRRGDGRLRPHRQVVRLRELGRRPGHHHAGQGDQLRLRAARRDDRLGRRSPTGCATSYFAGGLTYSGHPLACAAGVASIEAFREEGIVENAAAMGEVLGDGLAALADKHESIGEVRGLGLFYGVELVKDRETREPLVPFNASGEAFAPMAKIGKAALANGLYLMTHWNVIIVAPPLTITREELDEGLEKLDEALAAA